MTDKFVDIAGTFELLTHEEWSTYLSTNIFNKMIISPEVMGCSTSINFSQPKLPELIFQHNNKVGTLIVTYALCKHYFDKGIPDEPWYVSPGLNGTSIQYMPLFKDEHWMRRYWFSYFSDMIYLKISSIWDSVIEIINHYYGLDYPVDLRLRKNVLKWLKINAPDIEELFIKIINDDIYKKATKFRNSAAHGTSPSEVTSGIQVKSEIIETEETDRDGRVILDENGKAIIKRKRKRHITVGVGEYTLVSTIMSNIEEYSKFTGNKIQEIINTIATHSD